MFDEYQYGYYQTLRTEARKRTVDAFNRRIKSKSDRETWKGITLASMDKEALDAARTEWPRHYSNESHHGLSVSWERLYFRFLAKPANFNIAVWQTLDDGKILQGLALGAPSKSKHNLTINWVERSFAPTYFKGGVLLPILSCAEEYAKLLGNERVLIKDAIDPDQFTQYGYAPYDTPRNGDFLVKEL